MTFSFPFPFFPDLAAELGTDAAVTFAIVSQGIDDCPVALENLLELTALPQPRLELALGLLAEAGWVEVQIDTKNNVVSALAKDD